MQIGTVWRLPFSQDLEDSRMSTLCVVGSHTVVPTNWMCQKQFNFAQQNQKSFLGQKNWDWMVPLHLICGTNVSSSHQKLRSMCPQTTKQRTRSSLKKGVPQWDQLPGPTELRLIRCSIESLWTPKSKANTSTPKTNLSTFLPRKTSHVMDGWNHLLWLFNISHFSAAMCSDTMTKRCQQESWEERVAAKLSQFSPINFLEAM